MEMKNIKFQNVTKNYGDISVYNDFNLEIESGKITCLLGESGCGKTTLLNMLASLISYKGTILNIPEKISYIFQEERLLPNLTVFQNIKYVLGKQFDEQKVRSVLKKVELESKANVYPSQLSGGQAQRVSIARAFAVPSQLILMDEPFSSLDTALKIRLIAVFGRLWREERRTAVFVTHDVEEAYMLSHRALVMREGRIVGDILGDENIPREYGTVSEYRTKILKALLD